MGLPPPSAPSVLSLTLSLRSPGSGQWLPVIICLCLCQVLAESLWIQLYQAYICKHFLASAIVFVFCVCIWDGSLGGAVSGWHYLKRLVEQLHKWQNELEMQECALLGWCLLHKDLGHGMHLIITEIYIWLTCLVFEGSFHWSMHSWRDPEPQTLCLQQTH